VGWRTYKNAPILLLCMKSFTANQTAKRKIEHVNIVLQKPVQFTQKTTGFEEMEVEYLTLPELDAEKIDTRTIFLQHTFSFPFMVSSMTGGHDKTTIIN
jgi:isopentenyl-diphosphate Delta-isomerase